MAWKDSARPIDLGLLVLRVGIGLFFAVAHGLPKLMAGPERWEGLGQAIGSLGLPVVVPTAFGLGAALAEFLGGLLLAAGLLTRWAGAALLGTMIVASAFLAGQWDPAFATFGKDVARPMEMAVVFLALIFTGAGRLSLDATWRGR